LRCRSLDRGRGAEATQERHGGKGHAGADEERDLGLVDEQPDDGWDHEAAEIPGEPDQARGGALGSTRVLPGHGGSATIDEIHAHNEPLRTFMAEVAA
jgi:hypothetical protein